MPTTTPGGDGGPLGLKPGQHLGFAPAFAHAKQDFIAACKRCGAAPRR